MIIAIVTIGIAKIIDCFAAETLVLAGCGLTKIEDIKVGDKVWSYNEKTKQKELKTVKNIFRNKTKSWMYIFVYNEETNKEELIEDETTYNFEVEDNHNYFVSNDCVLVHNKYKLARNIEASGNFGNLGEDAHHLFTQKFRDDFTTMGIDIDDAANGRWMELHKYRRGARAYNR